MNRKTIHLCPLCGNLKEYAPLEANITGLTCGCSENAINLLQESPNGSFCKPGATYVNPEVETRSVDARLYSTEFCHLCVEATDILRQAGVDATLIDIAENDGLIELYGTRIPVLQRADNDAELCWPFDAATVSCFLE